MIDRLRLENDALNDRIGSLIQLLEREQVLRQQLQGQIAILMERQAQPPTSPPPLPALPSPMVEALEQQHAVLRGRLHITEAKFEVLTHAVAQLVAHLERRR